MPILLFVGAKLYAIAFYHFMEFTSATPPPHPAAYFAVEGPCLFSVALVLMRIGGSTSKPKRRWSSVGWVRGPSLECARLR